MEPPPAVQSMEPHEMRITGHGKIKTFVTFALNFLKENPKRPLILHTLPASHSTQEKATEGLENEQEEPHPAKRRKISQSTSTTSRLVSVVEIIKREFAALVATRAGGAGNELGTVLHQYNQVACLEDEWPAPLEVEGGDESEALLLALEGKNHLKQVRMPYMKVTLCTALLPHLEANGATYQCPPPPKKRSKGAKAREKKRRDKEQQQREGGNTASPQPVEPIDQMPPPRSTAHPNHAEPPLHPASPGISKLPATISSTPSPTLRLRQSWKWAFIAQFLHHFESMLGLDVLHLEAIEHDLTSSSTAAVVTVIQKLLYTLTLDKKITADNWEQYFRKQYRRRAPLQNPFGILDGFEDDQPIHWNDLDSETKLTALHALCEWHFVNPNRMRSLMKIDEDSTEWRLEPIGWDAERNAYWLMGGTRLWIQHPRPGAFRRPKPIQKKPLLVKGSRKTKGKGKRPAPETLGTTSRRGRPPNSAKLPAASSRGTRSRPPPPSDSEPPAKRARLSGTRISSRLRGIGEEEWQVIPDKWLEEVVVANGVTKGKAKGKAKQESVLDIPSTLFDDDLSELTESSDSDEAVKEEDVEEEPDDDDDDVELSIAEDPGFVEWETICAALGEWEAVKERFATSTHTKEKALHRRLIDNIIPGVIVAFQELERKLLPPPEPEPEPYVGRKRSSRLAIKESQMEEIRLQERRRREMEELLERLRNGDETARLDDDERTKRNAAREIKRKAKMRDKKTEGETTTAPSTNGSQPSPDEYMDVDDSPPPEPQNELPAGIITPTKRMNSTSNSGTQTPASDEPWLLDCDLCGKSGWNVDDGTEIACCEKCSKWQHVQCHDAADQAQGRPLRNWAAVEFVCGPCQRKTMRLSTFNNMLDQSPQNLMSTYILQPPLPGEPRPAYHDQKTSQGYNLYPNALYYSMGSRPPPLHPVLNGVAGPSNNAPQSTPTSSHSHILPSNFSNPSHIPTQQRYPYTHQKDLNRHAAPRDPYVGASDTQPSHYSHLPSTSYSSNSYTPQPPVHPISHGNPAPRPHQVSPPQQQQLHLQQQPHYGNSQPGVPTTLNHAVGQWNTNGFVYNHANGVPQGYPPPLPPGYTQPTHIHSPSLSHVLSPTPNQYYEPATHRVP